MAPRNRRCGTPPSPRPSRRWHRRAAGALLLAVLGLAGCQTPLGTSAPTSLRVYQSERFERDDSFSRLFDAGSGPTCEAARRALLSQGYLIDDTPQRPGTFQGRKHFQPQGEVHVQILFHVSCVDEGPVSTAFVSAIQEQYVLRRSSTSASVGVSAIGSLSIPLGSTGDALVKVGSMTIPGGPFYDRFFGLMERFLREAADDAGADTAPPGER